MSETTALALTQQSEVKPQTKVCPGCGRELPLNAFYKHNLSEDGLTKLCKECAHRRGGKRKKTSVNPLERFTARELMHELNQRGYKGELTYTEVKVHKMNLKDF